MSTLATMVVALSLLGMPTAALSQSIVGNASVIDGDTIKIHSRRIRLFGIDAPEGRLPCLRPTGERWRCGQQASFALSDRIGRGTVRWQPRDRDRYGRVVAVCFSGSKDLNRWMVLNGWPSRIGSTQWITSPTSIARAVP